MSKIIVLICIAFGLTGCVASYIVPDSAAKASFYLAVQSDAESTSLRNISLTVLGDENCKEHQYGTRAGSNIHNVGTAGTDTVKILANEKFVFTAMYVDARFAQNRKCVVTASFVPTEHHTYKALLAVTDDVRACKLGIYDVTSGKDQQLEFSMPKYACDITDLGIRPNGQPLWINWKATVTTIPGKK